MMMRENRPITIDDLLIYAENDSGIIYESDKFRDMYCNYVTKIENIQKEVGYDGDLVEGNGGFCEIVYTGQHEYFKAGFCAGVRLLAESLGMNI